MNKQNLTREQIKVLESQIYKMSVDSFRIFIYWKAYYDKEFFGKFFLSHLKTKKTPEFHYELYKALGGEENINIICPRGHGKTTTLIIDIIHSLVYKLYSSQLYIASAGLGAETLGKIKYELETSTLIKDIFGNLVPRLDTKMREVQGTKKWREKMLELTNGESIETLSKGNPVRGKRPKRIIVDDFEENKDVMTKTNVDKTRHWFFTSLYNTLLPGGKIVILGTVVGNLCMVKYIKDTKDWKTIEYKAINNGIALWADMWSIEELAKRKKEIGSILFNQEFMNIPFQSENTIIKQEHIQYFEYNNEQFDYIYIGVDPAISEKTTSDDFAIVITGTIGDKKYVLESKALKGKEKDPFKATNTVYNLYKKWNANKVIVETVAFQQVMSKLFKVRGIATTEIVPHKDKVTRLMERQGDFEQGNIYFNKELTLSLVEQLTMFPDVEHDDEVDGMVYSFGLKRKKLLFID